MEKQRAKQRSKDAKDKLAKRGVTAEPTFAFAKEALAFRRWSYRNLEGVRTQWSLICTTINLRKLFAVWCRGKITLAQIALA